MTFLFSGMDIRMKYKDGGEESKGLRAYEFFCLGFGLMTLWRGYPSY